MSLVNELLEQYEHLVETITLVPSDGGKFEVSINGTLLFSKLDTRRHAQPGEILGLVREVVGE